MNTMSFDFCYTYIRNGMKLKSIIIILQLLYFVLLILVFLSHKCISQEDYFAQVEKLSKIKALLHLQCALCRQFQNSAQLASRSFKIEAFVTVTYLYCSFTTFNKQNTYLGCIQYSPTYLLHGHFLSMAMAIFSFPLIFIDFSNFQN